MMVLFRELLGDFDFTHISESGFWLAYIFYIAFSLSGILLLVNLVVALMTNSFERVQQDNRTAFLKSRAEAIVKKMRVFILSDLRLINGLMVPSLHPWQNKKIHVNSEKELKWQTLIRSCLFRPDRHQASRDENYQAMYKREEYRLGVVSYSTKVRTQSDGDDSPQAQQLQFNISKMLKDTILSQINSKLDAKFKEIQIAEKEINDRMDIQQRNQNFVAALKQIQEGTTSARIQAITDLVAAKVREKEALATLSRLLQDEESTIREQVLLPLNAMNYLTSVCRH